MNLKYYILTSGLILLASVSSFAQTYVVQVKPEGKNVWTYANLKGEILFEAPTGKKYPFSEDGIAILFREDKNRYSFFNLKGEIIHVELDKFYLKDPLGYGATGSFNGLVAVEHGGKWGYLNKEGKIAIPLKYDYASNFDNNIATVRQQGLFYIIDKEGNETLLTIPDIIEIKQFHENLAPFRIKGGLEGFIDNTGNIVIMPGFLQVGFFNKSELTWARSTSELIGYINKKGEWVIEPQFTYAGDFDAESGMARVMYNGQWKYVNKSGNIIVFDISPNVKEFSDGLAIGKINRQVGFYNNKGEWVISPRFRAVRDFKNGFAAASVNDLWGVIDKTGNWIIEPEFEAVKDVVIVK